MEKHIELHVHPYLNKNSLADIVAAMDKTNIDVLALENLDDSIYPQVRDETKKACLNLTTDYAGVKLLNGKYLLNAREYNTKEGFHILTVGYSHNEANPQTEIKEIIDEGLKHNALVLLDHPYADNGKTRTAGCISEKMEHDLENICREYSGQIALEWNAYCVPWVRKGLQIFLNFIGHKTSYYDINKKVEGLAEKLKKQRYNLPVIADTDLHARNKRLLKTMGTSRIIIDVEGECASDVVKSMKKNIFEGNYKNIKKTVSFPHLLRAYCLPVLIPKIFKKPRS
jgi:hypothetical protein